jgi:hypothetical protein
MWQPGIEPSVANLGSGLLYLSPANLQDARQSYVMVILPVRFQICGQGNFHLPRFGTPTRSPFQMQRGGKRGGTDDRGKENERSTELGLGLGRRTGQRWTQRELGMEGETRRKRVGDKDRVIRGKHDGGHGGRR